MAMLYRVFVALFRVQVIVFFIALKDSLSLQKSGNLVAKHGLVEKYKEVEHRGGILAAGGDVITGGLASIALNNPKWFSRGLYESPENIRECWGEFDTLLEPDLDKLLDTDAKSEITSEMINRFSREAARTQVGKYSAAELADVIKVHTLSL